MCKSRGAIPLQSNATLCPGLCFCFQAPLAWGSSPTQHSGVLAVCHCVQVIDSGCVPWSARPPNRPPQMPAEFRTEYIRDEHIKCWALLCKLEHRYERELFFFFFNFTKRHQRVGWNLLQYLQRVFSSLAHYDSLLLTVEILGNSDSNILPVL